VRTRHRLAALTTGMLLACATARAAEPETVLITFHAKTGAEAELARVIAKHWETVRALKLVDESAPHVTLRGTEKGGAFFVDVFTWRDADTPDHAPAPVLASWGDMTRLTEPRDGRPGIDIRAMSLVR
jgi:hypothetical protein